MFVIALLLGSVGTGMSIVYFAQSDGGAQVIDRSPPPPAEPSAPAPELTAPDAEAPSADH